MWYVFPTTKHNIDSITSSLLFYRTATKIKSFNVFGGTWEAVDYKDLQSNKMMFEKIATTIKYPHDSF